MPTPRATTVTIASGLSAMISICTFSAATGAESASAASLPTYQQTRIAVDDTYVDSGHKHSDRSASTKLVASHSGHRAKTALVKFRVPAVPVGYVRSDTRLRLAVKRTTGTKLLVKAVNSGWHGRSVSYRRSVVVGKRVAAARIDGHQKSLDVHVNTGLKAGRVAFSLSTRRGSTVLKSMDSGARSAPRLVFTYTLKTPTPVPAAAATPTGTSTSTSTPTPTPTPTQSPTPTPVPTPRPAVTSTAVSIGMSTSVDEWAARLAETGPVKSRRLFSQMGSPDASIRLATSEVAAGRMPIVSFKVPNNDWAGVGAGKYDTQLKGLTTRLAAIGGRVVVTLHHEPTGDGTPANYAAMMRHALPILGAPANVYAGPIVNGFWWSSKAMGLTDAEIAQWLPADVLSKSEVVASDTYQGGDATKPGERAGIKIANMSKWATRVGVKKLGLGEYNGVDAASITAAGDAVLADPRFLFASLYNSNVNNRDGISWTLTGDRLTAFRGTLAKARALAN